MPRPFEPPVLWYCRECVVVAPLVFAPYLARLVFAPRRSFERPCGGLLHEREQSAESLRPKARKRPRVQDSSSSEPLRRFFCSSARSSEARSQGLGRSACAWPTMTAC